MKKKQKLTLMILIVLVIAGMVVAIFWNSVSVFLFPGKVLSESVLQVYEQLQLRFEENPLLTAMRYIDLEGKQSADLTIQTSDSYLGEIRYDMNVQIQPHRFRGEGVVNTGGSELDISVYADMNYMALASDELLRGSYYGITYDSFMQDIRKIPLLSWMLGDTVLQKWNQSVLDVKQKMMEPYTILRLPQLPETDIRPFVLQMAMIPAKVTKEQIRLQDQTLECFKIAYSIENEQVTALLRQYMDVGNGATAHIGADFYIYEKSLILADVRIDAEELSHRMKFAFGMNAAADPLTLLYRKQNPNDVEETLISVETKRELNQVGEKWHIETDSVKTDLEYQWYPATGDMKLKIGESGEIDLSLSETENGLVIKSANLSDVYSAISGRNKNNGRIYSGSVIIRKGAEFAEPEFKNLDQWSMDDFLILLEGIGGLIGLEFA